MTQSLRQKCLHVMIIIVTTIMFSMSYTCNPKILKNILQEKQIKFWLMKILSHTIFWDLVTEKSHLRIIDEKKFYGIEGLPKTIQGFWLTTLSFQNYHFASLLRMMSIKIYLKIWSLLGKEKRFLSAIPKYQLKYLHQILTFLQIRIKRPKAKGIKGLQTLDKAAWWG